MTGRGSPPATARAALERRYDEPAINANRPKRGEDGPDPVRTAGTRRHYRIADSAVVNVLDRGRAIGEGD